MNRTDFGKVITFYSYKGGTGRSMAITNTAYLLSQKTLDKGILLIDWDLEAPGLHLYLEKYADIFTDQPGLIDLLYELIGNLKKSRSSEIPDNLFDQIDIQAKYIINTDFPKLYFLKAGKLDEEYTDLVRSIEWEKLYESFPDFFSQFANYLSRKFDYILIDSRTGVTDIGGICTTLMPEKLVAVFTPNRQSLYGLIHQIDLAVNHRKRSNDIRPITVYPLPSRIEIELERLQSNWRFGNSNQSIIGYQKQFEDLFRSIYHLDTCDLSNYFDQVQIQHVPEFAYGEEIASATETTTRLSLARSYQIFEKALTAPQAPWDFSTDKNFEHKLSGDTKRKIRTKADTFETNLNKPMDGDAEKIPAITIGLWGPPGSGKTSYLMMLQTMVNKEWSYRPIDATSNYFFAEGTRQMILERHFPSATALRSPHYLGLFLERLPSLLKKRRAFRLLFIEASGENFVNTDTDEAELLLREMGKTQGNLWLIDPEQIEADFLTFSGGRSSYKSALFDTIWQLIENHGRGIIENFNAFCLTKMDLPEFKNQIGFPKEFCLDLLGPRFESLLANHFHSSKTEFFSTSAVGFIPDTQLSNRDPKDAGKLIAFPKPFGLFDPIKWILDKY